MKRLVLAATAAALAASGCSPSHISSYTPKKRQYELPVTKAESATGSNGSLWQDGGRSALLFTDQRALRENDVVVVRVEEIANAQRSSDTQLDRQARFSGDVAAFLSRVGTPSFDLSAKGSANSDTGLQAQGSTGRSEKLTATVPSLVRKVLPNGNLFIEGHRVVLVNQEEQHFYISGVVRPIDIDQQNSVKSSLIADAEIEFTGRGVLTDNQNQGALARFWSYIWPF